MVTHFFSNSSFTYKRQFRKYFLDTLSKNAERTYFVPTAIAQKSYRFPFLMNHSIICSYSSTLSPTTFSLPIQNPFSNASYSSSNIISLSHFLSTSTSAFELPLIPSDGSSLIKNWLGQRFWTPLKKIFFIFQFPWILLAVPKKKTTPSRKGKRAANKGLPLLQNITKCEICSSPKLLHHICPNCYAKYKDLVKKARENGQSDFIW